jgi:hypothetical protein
MVFGKSHGGLPCRFPARRDLDAVLQPPDIDRAFGGTAVASDQRLDGVRGYREVNAYSTAWPELAREDD